MIILALISHLPIDRELVNLTVCPELSNVHNGDWKSKRNTKLIFMIWSLLHQVFSHPVEELFTSVLICLSKVKPASQLFLVPFVERVCKANNHLLTNSNFEHISTKKKKKLQKFSVPSVNLKHYRIFVWHHLLNELSKPIIISLIKWFGSHVRQDEWFNRAWMRVVMP